MNNFEHLVSQFQSVFETNTYPQLFFAPGRINLIGEHTDYNGGHVFPASISYGTYALAGKREDKKLRLYSVNFPTDAFIEFDIRDLSQRSHDWTDYPKGVLLFLQKAGYSINHGIDLLFYGNIPNGAGLSSSASIEIVTGVMAKALYDLDIEKLELVKIGQKVENDFIGVNSGIMDQFAVGMGKENHAILLNCETLEFSYSPFQLQDYTLIIIDTNKQRTLAGSKYNERRHECESALVDLQKDMSIQFLCELSPQLFEKYEHLITNSINKKRAKHVIYENARTQIALEKLQQYDLIGFGQLMNESHQSLRDDYEVSCLELDTIVEEAWNIQGVIGARMTGAGFGGCALALVANEQVNNFKQKIHHTYTEKIGYEPTFYTPTIGDGAKEINDVTPQTSNERL
ncbi:galactokinase [Alkalihalobacillus pseudalcaliphilus]|uniref:galactokinase n=1 Tax=Alkalihalobacillus pseudalcaliphilus TaxID=79884 RepID=UPI00064D95AF|nr:galactokinase [Alkalihalobacillus pseudalcaliphilus]KMK74672.1 galactokinase [Alkalihalobacillus pseudalcaliphilus]